MAHRNRWLIVRLAEILLTAGQLENWHLYPGLLV